MKEAELHSTDLWVGKFSAGGYVVFDPEMQIPSPFVFLFGVNSREMRFYRKNWVRNELSKEKTSNHQEKYKRLYLDWKRGMGMKILDQNLVERLNSLETELELRNTWCWSCTSKIEGKSRMVCLRCGWFTCPVCGSCASWCPGEHIRLY